MYRWVASVVLVGACASQDPIDERVHTYEIAAGQFVELVVELTEGHVSNTTWTASATLLWQVHAHVLGELTIYEQGTGAAGTATFVAPQTRTFGVQWSNFTDDLVALDVVLDLPTDAVLLEW